MSNHNPENPDPNRDAHVTFLGKFLGLCLSEKSKLEQTVEGWNKNINDFTENSIVRAFMIGALASSALIGGAWVNFSHDTEGFRNTLDSTVRVLQGER